MPANKERERDLTSQNVNKGQPCLLLETDAHGYRYCINRISAMVTWSGAERQAQPLDKYEDPGRLKMHCSAIETKLESDNLANFNYASFTSKKSLNRSVACMDRWVLEVWKWTGTAIPNILFS